MNIGGLYAGGTALGMDDCSGLPGGWAVHSESRVGGPRVVRLPADWWDPPSAASCPLTPEPQAARKARGFTRKTLHEWDLAPLTADAEAIVGEIAANAVTHGVMRPPASQPAPGHLGVRLMRRTGELICAVLDPSDAAPVMQDADGVQETGRGLRMVAALSDVWGWSPLPGRGKAVWAILFCPDGCESARGRDAGQGGICMPKDFIAEALRRVPAMWAIKGSHEGSECSRSRSAWFPQSPLTGY